MRFEPPPSSGALRLLTVAEAALGFSFFTLTITYFLSVYSALQRRNTFASVLHHKSSGEGDARPYVVSFAAAHDLSDLAARTADLVESHTFYPVRARTSGLQPIDTEGFPALKSDGIRTWRTMC